MNKWVNDVVNNWFEKFGTKHSSILIIFGRNIPEKIWLEKMIFISYLT